MKNTVIEKVRISKECPAICKECAEKKNLQFGSKLFFYCCTFGLPCKNAADECPYQ